MKMRNSLMAAATIPALTVPALGLHRLKDRCRARMQRGQVLDKDPIPKMQTVVAQADDQRIVIASRNAAGEIDSEYDRHTGMLAASSFYGMLSEYQRTIRLHGRE